MFVIEMLFFVIGVVNFVVIVVFIVYIVCCYCFFNFVVELNDFVLVSSFESDGLVEVLIKWMGVDLCGWVNWVV